MEGKRSGVGQNRNTGKGGPRITIDIFQNRKKCHGRSDTLPEKRGEEIGEVTKTACRIFRMLNYESKGIKGERNSGLLAKKNK